VLCSTARKIQCGNSEKVKQKRTDLGASYKAMTCSIAEQALHNCGQRRAIEKERDQKTPGKKS